MTNTPMFCAAPLWVTVTDDAAPNAPLGSDTRSEIDVPLVSWDMAREYGVPLASLAVMVRLNAPCTKISTESPGRMEIDGFRLVQEVQLVETDCSMTGFPAVSPEASAAAAAAVKAVLLSARDVEAP